MSRFHIVTRLSRRFAHYISAKVIFAMDMALSLTASLIVVLLSDLVVPSLFDVVFVFEYLGIAIVWNCILYFAFGTHRRVIRHVAPADILLLALASFIKGWGCVGTVTLLSLLGCNLPFVKAYWFIGLCDACLTFIFYALVRAALVVIYHVFVSRLKDERNIKRVLVCGITSDSVAVVKRLFNSSSMNVIGFIVSKKTSDCVRIEGQPVYVVDSTESLVELADKVSIDAILFPNMKAVRRERAHLLEYMMKAGIRALVSSEFSNLGSSITNPNAVRDIRIEDVLGREEITVSVDKISEYVHDKVILVTGAAGSIGSELCRQLIGFGVRKLILFDNGETALHNLRLEIEENWPELDFVPVVGDVRIVDRLDFVFDKWHPDIVFHAAAYKHVPLMEENPCESVLVNLQGTKNVADMCIKHGAAKMVMISTDKAVNPTNIMGCSKRLAEIYVQSLGLAIEKGGKTGCTAFVTTRFGNVLGSNGSVIPRFAAQIAKGGPVTVTHPEINRFFMTIPEACRLVMEAATMSQGNNIFVFDMGDSVKIDDLARRMILLAGFKPDDEIKIVYTGLRPGEKLFEEVLASEEDTLASGHERIRIAKVREYDYESLTDTFDSLISLSRKVQVDEMVKLMKAVVPEFVSQNSRFTEFDKKD